MKLSIKKKLKLIILVLNCLVKVKAVLHTFMIKKCLN